MYQQITLIGNLGNDPESRKTPSGKNVASFRLAVNKSWTDGSGEKQEKATWFRVSAWDKLAEIVSLYTAKGRQVMVVGEIEGTNAYIDKDGKPAASIEVTARTIKLLGGRGTDDEEAPVAKTQPAPKRKLAEEDIPF